MPSKKQGRGSVGASIARDLSAALRLHRCGDLAAAEVAYDQVLACDPSNAAAWSMKGTLALQRGRADLAVASLLCAVELDASVAGTFVNLGNAYRSLGRLTNAEAAYRRAVDLDPRLAIAHNNLGNVLRDLGQVAEAAECFTRATALEPALFAAASNLAHALIRLGRPHDECLATVERALKLADDVRDADKDVANLHNAAGNLRLSASRFDDAVECYRRAVECDPSFFEAHLNLAGVLARRYQLEEAVTVLRAAIAIRPAELSTYPQLALALRRLRRHDEAAQVYADWHERDPDDPIAAHMARTGVPVEPPERASASYVRREFDQFADRFDDVLVSKLGYRAPALVSEALAEARSNACLRVLDAGCGTGLCAPLLRPHADRLVGVDLSSRMLEKARERGGYDALHEGDLSELPRSFDGAFDVVVAADVILYFGRLDGVLRAFRGVLDANGILIFTVEAAASERGWTLGEGGRFAHDERYVRAVLAEAGFVVAALREEVLRYELGEAVRGLVVTAVTA